jgi:hypothetical protein
MRTRDEMLQGQSVRVKFHLQSVDPLSGAKSDLLTLEECVIEVYSPGGSLLESKALDSGVAHYGEGWWGATFRPTEAGNHTAKLTGRDQDRHARGFLRFQVDEF